MDELDSYSRTVSAVAAEITGRVAAVRTGRGSGSAVVVPGDGVLVTNAHVVGSARRGRADFVDGRQVAFIKQRFRWFTKEFEVDLVPSALDPHFVLAVALLALMAEARREDAR